MSEGYDSGPDTIRHIAEVRYRLSLAIRELQRRATDHDASKLQEPEKSVFDEFTPKLRDSTYGSDEYKGFLEGMGEGLRHHYAHNDHHPEHFEDGITGMHLLQVVEMLCDWIAATQRHADGDIYRSIEQNAERFGYGPEIKRLLLNTVPLLRAELAEARVERDQAQATTCAEADRADRLRAERDRYREALRQIIDGGAVPWVQRIARAALRSDESLLGSGRGK